MKTYAVTTIVALSSVAAAACSSEDGGDTAVSSSQPLTGSEMLEPLKNDRGSAQTATATGSVDTDNAFFQSLGTNGRSCGSCHVAEEAWTISPAGLQKRFDATGGLDPVFVRLDGADSPTAPITTVDERRAASSNLLSRGTIRVGLPRTRPTLSWDIEVEQIADPRNTNALTPINGQVSFFRRPLPVANLRFTAAINWDGRNTPDQTNMRPGLLNQSNGGTTGHAQGAPLPDATRAAIVDFELGLYTAQVMHDTAGNLTSANALGGPGPLVTQPFAIGANSSTSFDRKVFTIFDAWNGREDDGLNAARADVAAGQRIFNEKTFGPNGDRTCSGCHNAPNVGSSTRFAFFDVGVSKASRWSGNVPLYRVTQRSNPANVIETTDPGRAMITGQWADVNKFKVPGLRGLAAHPPYFHDGSAATIADVVDHYEQHFGIAFAGDEKRQLVSFLESL
jgi:cytochrome c peroxidase